MRISRRFLGVSLACLPLLAACERGPIDYELDGTWAWETQTNCYGNENTIVFSGPRIQVFQYGEPVVSIDNAKYEQKSHQGQPLIIVRYSLKVQNFEAEDLPQDESEPEVKTFQEEYLAADDNTLLPAETKMNGERQIPAAGSGKMLVRCPTPPAP